MLACKAHSLPTRPLAQRVTSCTLINMPKGSRSGVPWERSQSLLAVPFDLENVTVHQGIDHIHPEQVSTGDGGKSSTRYTAKYKGRTGTGNRTQSPGVRIPNVSRYTIPVVLFLGRQDAYVALWSGDIVPEGEQTGEGKAQTEEGECKRGWGMCRCVGGQTGMGRQADR